VLAKQIDFIALFAQIFGGQTFVIYALCLIEKQRRNRLTLIYVSLWIFRFKCWDPYFMTTEVGRLNQELNWDSADSVCLDTAKYHYANWNNRGELAEGSSILLGAWTP